MRILDLARAARRRLSRGRNASRYQIVVPAIERAHTSSYCSIVAIIKDEALYLDEWIGFHSLMGCEHFYIYDNGSTDGSAEVLEKYRRQGRVTTIPWPHFMGAETQTHYQAQRAAYAHALSAFGPSSRWMMFIDIDEFVYPTERETLVEALLEFEDVACLLLPWHMFGHSGHRTRPDGLVVENYTMRSQIPNPHVPPEFAPVLTRTKCIVDPTRVRAVRIHEFPADGPTCTVRRTSFSETDWAPSERDKIVLNHYYARSEEEFETKLRKGPRKDPVSNRALSEDSERKRRAVVEAVERAPVEDLRIQRFVPKLKEQLGAASADSASTG